VGFRFFATVDDFKAYVRGEILAGSENNAA